MNTINLESQVREALIQQRTREFEKIKVDSKEAERIVDKYLKPLFTNSIQIAILGGAEAELGKLSEQDKKEFKKELGLGKKELMKGFSKVRKEILKSFKDLKKRKEACYRTAKQQYMSSEELMKIYKPHFDELRQQAGVSKNVAKAYEDSFRELFKHYSFSDRLVTRLVQIAEKDGIEKAVQEQTRYKVIRELFPTPADYRVFEEAKIDSVEKFCSHAQSALSKDGAVGKIGAQIYGMMGELMKKIKIQEEKRMKTNLEKEIKQIYR